MAGLRSGLAMLVAALAVGATGCADAGLRESGRVSASSVPATRALDPGLAATLDDAIAGAMTAASIPGAVVGIFAPDGDYLKAFGVADTTDRSPMQTDFHSRIGSVTKTFTATAVLQLAGDGTLGLDDPIANYLDGVPNGAAITVRQLAGMTSGLADYTRTDGFQEAVIADPRRDLTPRQLLDWAFAEPPAFPPGERVEYCNTNYILLGLLVEKLSGAPLANYLTEHILDPLGMRNTTLPGGTGFPEPHARGYTEPPDGSGAPVDATDWSASLTWAAGGLVSTLADVRLWMSELAAGSLITPELQDQRMTTRPEPGAPADFGYGLGIFTVAGWVGHNGSVPGFQTVALHLPDRDTTLVVMLNTDIAVPDRGDPSEVLTTAITEVITPGHVYRL